MTEAGENGTKRRKFFQIFLSESILLLLATALFMFVLVRYFLIVPQAAIELAALSSGIAALLFLFISFLRHRRNLARTITLLGCLLFCYGVGLRWIPRGTIANQTVIFRELSLEKFIREQGVNDVVFASVDVPSSSYGSSWWPTGQYRNFNCTVRGSQSVSNELLKALKINLNQKLDACDFQRSDSNEGEEGSTGFSVFYSAPYLRGHFRIFSRKFGDNEQRWYGYHYE